MNPTSPRKSLISRVLALCLALLCLQSAMAETAEARFRALGRQLKTVIQVDDAIFSEDGRRYHQLLARASLGLAISAFRAPADSKEGRGGNVIRYLEDLKFEDLSLEQYEIEPSDSSIASALGMKTIKASDGLEYKLLAVAISGAGYKDEWKSNFAIGDGLHHQGFNRAAENICARVKAYLNKHPVDQNHLKIWISGYSRAAATANRSAAILLDQKIIEAQNLYAYTFATPNVTTQKDAPQYPSIFNVISPLDPIALVPFESWGFRRYGHNLFLPSPQTDSAYVSKLSPVKPQYRIMTGIEMWTNLSADHAIKLGLASLSESLSNRGNYARDLQPLLIDFWNKRSKPLSLLPRLVTLMTRGGAKAGGMFDRIWTVVANTYGERVLQDAGLFSNNWKSDQKLNEALIQGHDPAVYVAWMLAYSDREGLFSENMDFLEIHFKGVQTAKLLNEKGETVASYPFQKSDPGIFLPFSADGDALMLTVPLDKSYSLSLKTSSVEKCSLILRKGRVGSTQAERFRADEKLLESDTEYQLAINKADWGSMSLIGPSRKLAFLPCSDIQGLDPIAQNSSAKEFLTSNLLAFLVVLLGAAAQILLYLSLSARGAWRFRRNYRAKKLGLLPQRADRTPFFIPKDHRNNSLRLANLLIFGLSIIFLFSCGRIGIKWLELISLETQKTLVWFVTLQMLPFALLLLLAAIPAGASACLMLSRKHLEKKFGTGRLLIGFAAVQMLILLIFYHDNVFASMQYEYLVYLIWPQFLLSAASLFLIPRKTKSDKKASKLSEAS